MFGFICGHVGWREGRRPGRDLPATMLQPYNPAMSRFALRQSDLFASAGSAPEAPPCAPVDELTALLERLRTAERLPWPDAAAAMAEEQRALGLARLAGSEGERLAAAILRETERLLAAAEKNPQDLQ
ncbi:MAG: hypothetical protein JO264_07265 [Acidisphaera sp.]|nr:hypothetical protein [Acidisphaera sp.]